MTRTAISLTLAAALAGCATGGGIERLRPGQEAYTAVGTEPFWTLTIDPRVIIFTDRSNNVRVTETTPRASTGPGGQAYRTTRMQVTVTRGRCNDGMSDRAYPERVQVQVDGRTFQGCGGEPLAPGSLANTSWTVDSVNGQAVPAGASNFMRFTEDRLSGRFGCNTVNGRYVVTGETLSAGAIGGTRVTCPDMTAEQNATRILAQPITLDWTNGERLTLRNAQGSIVLRRGI